MFIYSVRASGIKFFALVLGAIAILIGIIASGQTVFASAAISGEVNFGGIKTEEDRIAFMKACGIDVDAASVKSSSFVMPENFDRVMVGYNELQKTQGLDISKYSRKKVTRYTYEVVGFEGYDGAVFANLLIYRNRIIACDVSSGDPEGFVKPMVIQG